MHRRNRIDLKRYRTAEFMRWVIWHFDLRSNTGRTLTKRGPCPLCCATVPTSRSLAVDVPRGVWYCHGCKQNGDAITLYSKVAQVSCWQAAIDLSQLANTPVPWLDSSGETLTEPTGTEKHTTPGLALGNNQSTLDGPTPQAEKLSEFQTIIGRDASRN